MNRILFFFFLSFAFSFALQAEQTPVPVQIPEQELTRDLIQDAEFSQSEKETEEKVHSILKSDSIQSGKKAESDSQPVAEEIPSPAPQPVAEEIPSPAPQPVAEEIPSPAPQPVAEEIPSPVPQPVVEEIPSPVPQPVEEEIPSPVPQPVVEEIPSPAPQPVEEEIPVSIPQPIRTASGLIPFNPSDSLHEIPVSMPGYAVTDPAGLLSSVFQKYQFPYAFISVEVLSANVESQPIEDQLVQMKLPLMISFNTESFAAFQMELESVLEMISSNFQNELAQLRPGKARKGFREGVMLNVPDGTGNYKAYELPKECREVLAQYAALIPVGKMTLYDEKEQGLQNWFFPLLYRDIVKAFPINLLEVYQSDYQTIRILENQNEPFMEFVQTQGRSFVIPENFPVVQAHSACANFLEKQAKIYYLEPVFRRSELLPQIPMVLEMQVPVEQFQKIRFMNCEIMTDRQGETVVKPTENFVLQDEEVKSPLTGTNLRTPQTENLPVVTEEVSEELPFILEEAPAQ